jgi:heterodisulfide reductase subunit D
MKTAKSSFSEVALPISTSFSAGTLDSNSRDILVDSIRLLNFFDIHPAILQNLRCCGHDLLWSGDKPNFLKLAKAKCGGH